MDEFDNFDTQEIEKSLKNLSKIENNTLIKGKIVGIYPDKVIIDVGLKSEAIIPVEELFANNSKKDFKIGDEIDVYLINKEDSSGLVRVSYNKAIYLKNLNIIQKNYEDNQLVEVLLKKKVKGGIICDLLGFDVFMPLSQIGFPPLKNIEKVIGKKVPAKIIEFEPQRKNIVVSWRKFLEEEIQKKQEEFFAKIEKEPIVTGKVKKITSFGAFINLGVFDGLLRKEDISWGKINKIEDKIKVGQILKLKVLSFDREKNKISLGLKQLKSHPWENIEKKYPINSIVKGKITRLFPFGALVELDEGIEGMIHINDMSWSKEIKNPAQVVKIGDWVKVQVLNVNPQQQRISLGLKQIQENPYEKYRVNEIVCVKIKKILKFNLLVEIEPQIEGIIHISQVLNTGKKVDDLKNIFRVGDETKAKIIKVQPEKQEIELSIKEYQKIQESQEIAKYMNQTPPQPTLGDIFADKLKNFKNEKN